MTPVVCNFAAIWISVGVFGFLATSLNLNSKISSQWVKSIQGRNDVVLKKYRIILMYALHTMHCKKQQYVQDRRPGREGGIIQHPGQGSSVGSWLCCPSPPPCLPKLSNLRYITIHSTAVNAHSISNSSTDAVVVANHQQSMSSDLSSMSDNEKGDSDEENSWRH